MHFFPLYSILFIVFIGQIQAQETATVYGTVNLAFTNQTIKRGDGYNKDGSPKMESDNAMAKQENNIIISFHPLTFEPELTLTQNASITQKEQTFLPHVLPVMKGSTVYLLNEDEFFHNIYSLTPGSRFNIGRRPPGSPYPIKIKKQGIIKLSCDIHPHMFGIILSLDTPYFTRLGSDGKYSLSGLPKGKYEVQIYSSGSNTRKEIVEISKGEPLELNFDLKGIKVLRP